jgi:hypothetical protein
VRDALLSYEQYIRLAAFCGVFALMAAWELVEPRRVQTIGRGWRWPNNLGLVVVDTLLVRILFPTTAVGLALVAEAHGLGLFNVLILPAWIGVVASVVPWTSRSTFSMCFFTQFRGCGACIECIMPISTSM